MKAVIHTAYGAPEVLHLSEVETPTPKDNEVLIRVHAANINYGDLLARQMGTISRHEFNMPSLFWIPARLSFGLRRPRNPILGNELSGVIAAVGKDVTRFAVGDAVMAYRADRMGAWAEYVCMPQDGLITHKPPNVTHEMAAVLPYGMLTALSLLGKADIQRGQKVLINGASGSIGSAAVQLAKLAGAEVTGVCATPRLEMVKALGADHVIDYTREDFTRQDTQYDVIFDVLGRLPFGRCRRVLTADGRYLAASFKLRQVMRMLWTSKMSRQKVICTLSGYDQETLRQVADMLAAGQITAVIDRVYPLAEAAEANRYVEAGGKTGNVLLGAV